MTVRYSLLVANCLFRIFHETVKLIQQLWLTRFIEVMQILDFYASVYEELLAVPVIKGQKTGGIYICVLLRFV
jgi:hypothetical protein